MPTGSPVDGFALAYDRLGAPGRQPVVLLHGWPGDRTDMAAVAERLSATHDVVVPDLRGFGESDKHDRDPTACYSAAAQARGVAALADELGLSGVVLGGYDVGSGVARALAGDRPDLLRAMVLGPPAPGVGRRMLDEGPMREFWYQSFHQLDLAERLVDGRPDAARAYVEHFWTHWSGPRFAPDAGRLDHLEAVYGAPGAFVASIGWYRAGGGAVARALAEATPDPSERIGVPTTFLWPEHDPLFPRHWSDRVDAFFTDVRVSFVDGVGHFVPVEAPDAFADALAAAGS